ncbi:hypothetical protein CoNPh11_CDS0209 [Staphylococcus phage S-CoN_Ph11]|uniref:Uncharacterized protein n=1 Tax=Staphylococcus phage CF9 TaxID=3113741 RepID=A0AAX4J799_9CAUD|nr:hypothetical protein CoNPh1_CDS0014 [Staphylococcus phage S-CoN_Ph1]WNM51699.1 hypothetical protein CoNPh2_CDS0145 [Staphylococcus phage S-CoN_Ph2]WNM51860.1 hypothetical protein CoNPh3_CDS0146 [Staphylococcus phage S-CoN_Ph3]WNM51892.1 hypothetical protein CoNPh4_CDS0016 [Staphylococcus phage S-CoN_Ph4]WNM52075.1 hypothetical protein CoNPh5_CDS0029 [Staphylococcus phage S-CoN_Ph5]WNM52359.1 hypothetical protein CoNPh6_CDS0149 [Staphylococcus phage S-CoN_Ph6]WNM52537.1 hypothetical protein
MGKKIDYDKVTQVLRSSENDINIWDIIAEFDTVDDEETLEIIEEYIDEFGEFLNKALPHIMERLAIRIAFATAGDNE